MDFDTAVALVVDIETGQLTNTPGDPGGLTKYGISQHAYPRLDIANLTLQDAKLLYQKDYWEPVNGYQEIPSNLYLPLFECAVNQGVGAAIMLLQAAVHAVPDGIMGPATLLAVRQTDREELEARFAAKRAVAYTRLENWHIAGEGWLYRMFKMAQANQA